MFEVQKSLYSIRLSKLAFERVLEHLETWALKSAEGRLASLEENFSPSVYDGALPAEEQKIEVSEYLRSVIADPRVTVVSGYFTEITANGVVRTWKSMVGAEGMSLDIWADGATSFTFEASTLDFKVSIEQPYVGTVVLKVLGHSYESTESVEGTELFEDLLQIIEEFRVEADVTQTNGFRVFIGHGGDTQWKVLQRILQQSHGFTIEAFESEERAGYSTLETVDLMVRGSAVALVVMSGVDEMADGTIRARENVVHEVGFCQGALGIKNTIILLEEGTTEFTNIAGLTQIRFRKGDIISVEEKVVAALNLRKAAFDAAGSHSHHVHVA